jgi:predicted GNAT superfamily acetyltransferase
MNATESDTDADAITIRRAETTADYQACQEAQRRAWGITEEQYVVPLATMVGVQLHGGLVLGAFRPDGSAVGVSFAFLGRIDGRLGLYSQLTGVVPGQQGRGIGGRLKQAQWQFARDQGLELLAWAFDPLQAGNAHFNLHRLGARSHTFVENLYGLRTDALNAGVPTDRLIVTWSTTPQPRLTLDAAEIEQIPRVVRAVLRPDGLPDVEADAGEEVRTHRVLIEIPEDIGRLRGHAPERAERWRQAVTAAFTRHFASGFAAVDFLRVRGGDAARSGYLLTRP